MNLLNPIRVLQIGMYNNLGGIETFLMNYYRNINKNDIQFDFINMYDNICFQEEIIELGAHVYNIANVKKNPVEYCVELYKLVKKNKYRIVHIHMLSAANAVPIIICKLLNVKSIIVHSHNSNISKGFIKKVLNKLNKKIVLSFANEFAACSKKAGEWFFGYNVKFRIIKNAINIEKFKYNEQSRLKTRMKYGIDDKFVIGHVGRFVEQKNHEFLIDIFYNLLKEKRNSILILIGNGPLKSNIEKKIQEYCIQDKVIFMEVSNDDISMLYQAMDVFVLPSKFEGLPMVGVEAQACGLPCIFSDEITKEIKILSETIFLKIGKENMKNWVRNIIRINDIKSKDTSSHIIDFGFDIRTESKKLEQFYFDKYFHI